MSDSDFTSEAELVAEFVAQLTNQTRRENPWTVYSETAGWDVLLVHETGFQIGLEAKLSLNAKVIEQALDGVHSRWNAAGPDYRGVLVPAKKLQHHLGRICSVLGLGIIPLRKREAGLATWQWLNLPGEDSYARDWPHWCPAERCKLPDFVPDTAGGHKSPVQLTDWKVKAIKLMIVLERRGYVTRADMKALNISPSRWTDPWHGFLDRAPALGGYVRNGRTPDLRAQHPRNYAEIEAQTEQWTANCGISLSTDAPAGLFSGQSA